MALRQLLDAGAQADAKAPHGAHPTLQSCSWLGLALERHSTECFQVLLASGANPDTGHGPHSLAVAALAHALKKDGHPWGDFVGPLLAHPKAPLGKGGWGPDLLRELFQPQVAPSPTLTKALERVSQAIEAQVGTAGLNAVWIDAAGGHPPRFTQAFLDRAAMDAPGFLGLLIDEGQYRLAATLATEHRVQSSQVVCGPQQTPLDAWFEIKAAEEEQERLHEQNKGFRMFVGPVSGGSCRELPNRFLEEFAAINVLRGVFRRNATLASRPKP